VLKYNDRGTDDEKQLLNQAALVRCIEKDVLVLDLPCLFNVIGKCQGNDLGVACRTETRPRNGLTIFKVMEDLDEYERGEREEGRQSVPERW